VKVLVRSIYFKIRYLQEIEKDKDRVSKISSPTCSDLFIALGAFCDHAHDIFVVSLGDIQHYAFVCVRTW